MSSVSIIIVARQREQELEACLQSVLGQECPPLEVVVVLNGASVSLQAMVRAHAEVDPLLKRVDCEACTASAARNVGVRASSGEVVYFLDDDVILPPGGLLRLAGELAEHPAVDIFGGPNLTPPDAPLFAVLTGELLASAFGSGVSRARYRPIPARAASERELILCNMAVRRRVFQAGLRFPDNFFGGEENVLVGSTLHAGGRARYSPHLWVYHQRRGTLTGYADQMMRYGRGRAYAMLLSPGTFHLAFFLPVALLIYLFFLPPMVLITPWALLPLACYALLSAGATLAVCLRSLRIGWFLPLLVLFPLTHLLYGWGLVSTLAFQTARVRRERRRPINRLPRVP